ncbi:hypothetical protein JOC70_000347 [Clostridium pascui]|nr:hypothetical protein [Clostridium pascui]
MSRQEKAFIYGSIDLHIESEKKSISNKPKGRRRR